MATFSQFKSKYIIERRSKNVGDEGTKNIVKKLLGKDAIPDDGGKRGQARIERELGLNKPNKTVKKDKLIQDINKKLSASTTKGDQARALYGTEGGSTEGAGGAGETFKAKNTDKTLSTKQIDTDKVNARNAEILKANNKKPIKVEKQLILLPHTIIKML